MQISRLELLLRYAQETSTTRSEPSTRIKMISIVQASTNEPPTKPWMRLACLLYSNGIPLHNVALEVNQDLAAVTEFVTSERGIKIMQALVSENPERMLDIIEASSLDSLLKLVRLRDCGKTEAIQLSACSQLLDRFFPKAKAQDAKKKTNSSNEFNDVQAEIARLRAEIKEPT